MFHKEYREKLYVFNDRFDAGEKLGKWLLENNVYTDVVFGIPAGGIPVAYMVSKILESKLDVLVCRKVLIPWNREAGFGAVAPDGSYFIDHGLATYLGLTEQDIGEAVEEQIREIERRLSIFRCSEPYSGLNGLTTMVVDDGIAAGYTMSAAISYLLKQGVREVVVAVPTCHIESVYRLVDRFSNTMIYCLNPRSTPIYAVADAYLMWRDLEDEEVLAILRKARDEGLLAYRLDCL